MVEQEKNFWIYEDGKVVNVEKGTVEEIIDDLDPILHDAISESGSSRSSSSVDKRICQVDGVSAVVSAGCWGRRLIRLKSHGCIYAPPHPINPENRVTVFGWVSDERKVLDFINEHSKNQKTLTLNLSVTQIWWLRRNHDQVCNLLNEHGSAMTIARRQITLHSGGQALLNQCAHALFNVLSGFVDVKLKCPTLERCTDILKTARCEYDCFALWHEGVLEIQGDREVVTRLLTNADFAQLSASPAKFIASHPGSEKDFIRGKKDGKLIRIAKQCDSLVEVKDLLEGLLLQVIVTGPSFQKVSEAAALLDGELPTTIYRHIPQNLHRRLIGVGGKSIQKIMHKHGVYIKFYQQAEAELEFGSSEEWCVPINQFRLKNVVIKTPTKNGAACVKSYDDILEECRVMGEPVDVDETDEWGKQVSVEDVLRCTHSGNQLSFKQGKWYMVGGDDSHEQENIIDTNEDFFDLFPSAFQNATGSPPKRKDSISDVNDPIVFNDHNNDKEHIAPNIPAPIGEGAPAFQKELWAIEEMIESLFDARSVSANKNGRRNSLSIFEL